MGRDRGGGGAGVRVYVMMAESYLGMWLGWMGREGRVSCVCPVWMEFNSAGGGGKAEEEDFFYVLVCMREGGVKGHRERREYKRDLITKGVVVWLASPDCVP